MTMETQNALLYMSTNLYNPAVDLKCLSWSDKDVQSDTKKTGNFENPTKIEEIQGKKIIDRN